LSPASFVAPAVRRGLLRADSRTALIFSLPAILFLGVFMVYPLVDQVRVSLRSVSNDNDGGFVGIDNYVSVLQDSNFWNSVLITLQFALSCLILELALGLGLALAISRIVRGGGVLRTLVLIPTMITPAVAAINFRLIANYSTGILNWLLSLVGIPPVDWVGDPRTAMAALVAADVWRNTPFVMLVLSAGLLSLPQDVTEAAELDGATWWRLLVFIKLPLLAPLILIVVLFRIIDLLRTFDLPFVLTQGGPGQLTEVVSLRIYSDMFSGFFTSYAATEAIVFTALTLVLSLALVRFLGSARE
jgi:multiple sugar transport system permease protein